MLLNRRRDLRDADSNHRPLRAIRRSVARAITAIDADIADLAPRVEEVRARTGILLGCEDASVSPRDPRSERALRRCELELLSGSRRLLELRRLRAVLADTEHRLFRLQEAGLPEIPPSAAAGEVQEPIRVAAEREPAEGDLSPGAEPVARGGPSARTWPAKARTACPGATPSRAV